MCIRDSAHTEKRPVSGDVLEKWLNQSTFAELEHRIGGGSYSRQHDRAGAFNVPGIGGDHRLDAYMLKRARDTAQVASVVIDYHHGAAIHRTIVE